MANIQAGILETLEKIVNIKILIINYIKNIKLIKKVA